MDPPDRGMPLGGHFRVLSIGVKQRTAQFVQVSTAIPWSALVARWKSPLRLRTIRRTLSRLRGSAAGQATRPGAGKCRLGIRLG